MNQFHNSEHETKSKLFEILKNYTDMNEKSLNLSPFEIIELTQIVNGFFELKKKGKINFPELSFDNLFYRNVDMNNQTTLQNFKREMKNALSLGYGRYLKTIKNKNVGGQHPKIREQIISEIEANNLKSYSFSELEQHFSGKFSKSTLYRAYKKIHPNQD